MTNEEQTEKSFLDELYRQTGGEPQNQVSMYEVGSAIGYDKNTAGSLAEELMVKGLAELRTLAGGISITAEGLAILGISAPSTAGSTDAVHLSEGPVVSSEDIAVISDICNEIKADIAMRKTSYERLEEIVIDLKSIEVQLLSPRPKTAVIREIFRSLLEQLRAIEGAAAAPQLEKLLSP